MIPVAFHGHAGWLHGPQSERGVVICAPWGYEELCTHRALRDLAIGLAARGFSVLRFDWRGTGDSLGGAEVGLAEWIDGIAQAAAFLRAQAGVRRLALAGLRLGALPAAAAAARCGAEELMLLAPAPSGAAALREIRAAALLSQESGQDPDGTLRHAGFALPPGFQRELAALAPYAGVGARRALVLHPDPAGAACRGVLAALAKGGTTAEARLFPGLVELLQDARLAVTPDAAWHALADWLGSAHPAGEAPRPPAPVLAGEGFTETGLRLAGPAALAAVLCAPEQPRSHPSVLFLNTGANRRIGYGRMSVELARDLARHGVASLRLDGTGIGDSDAGPEGGRVVYTQASTADVAAALDAMQARGLGDITLVGLCSGAHAAWHATLADARVEQQVLVNLQRFVWHDGDPLDALLPRRAPIRSTRTYLRNLRIPETWRRAARGEVDFPTVLHGLRRRYGKRLLARLGPLLQGAGAPRLRIARDLRRLQLRGVRTLFVYSADDPGMDEFSEHLGHAGRLLRRFSGAQSVLIDDADHNLARPAARAQFAALLREALLEAPRRRPAWAALLRWSPPDPLTRSARNA